MEAYRVRIVDDKVYGKLERNVNKNQNEKVKGTIIEIDNPSLKEGMLYCPDIERIVDETERFLINKKINDITLIKTDFGHQLKSLGKMTMEEREEYFSLQDQYDNFYLNQVKFVEQGQEEEYLKNLKNVLNKDA